MNEESFLKGQNKYFASSYEQFATFGGPCVYFHRECLRAGETAFLSQRHIEMLYATLTAWGMHRMGDSDRTKTKLTDWTRFYGSITANAGQLAQFRNVSMLSTRLDEYLAAIERLRTVYETLDLTVAGATIVVNSKALHHLLPEFIPPIDRQYTIRFFRQPPDRWRDSSGKFRLIMLPAGKQAQFRLFHQTCGQLKRLADRIDSTLFASERERDVPPPKALDNAIVNYVRIMSKISTCATLAADDTPGNW